MKISRAYSYLVTPDKNVADKSPVNGVSVPLKGKLFGMLSGVFADSDSECEIPVRFTIGADGKQQNPIRELILKFAGSPTEATGRNLAELLRNVTTNRSGLGLLFVLVGSDVNGSCKVVISRFPADQGVVANPVAGKLQIDFVEQVFMKSAKAYKAAVYQDKLSAHGFWDGNVVDKQINAGVQHVADYWVRAFLQSDLKTTSEAGTRRLADAAIVALRKSEDIEIKQELTAAISIAGRQLKGKATSIEGFCSRYALSDAARDLVKSGLKNSAVFSDKFIFSGEEFQLRARLRSVSLDNGAVLTSELSKFDECFVQEKIGLRGNRVRFVTEGSVVDDKIKGR